METATGVNAGMMPTSASISVFILGLTPPPKVDDVVFVVQLPATYDPDMVVVVNVSQPSMETSENRTNIGNEIVIWPDLKNTR